MAIIRWRDAILPEQSMVSEGGAVVVIPTINGRVDGQRYDYIGQVSAVILVLTRRSSGVGVIHGRLWHLW